MPTDTQPRRRTPRPCGPLALKSFTTWHDGERVDIKAGEALSPDHPVVRAHPDKFGPFTPMDQGSRTVGPTKRYTPAPMQMAKSKPVNDGLPDELPAASWSLGFSPMRGTEEKVPEVLPTTSPVSLQLSPFAFDGIRSATRATPSSHETGGVLIGLRSRAKIIEARGCGSSAIRRRGSLLIDWRSEHSYVNDRRVAGDREIVVEGGWHTHPSGSVKPSRWDLLAWADTWRHANDTVFPTDHYVGLIVTNVGHAQGPALTAYVMRRERRRLVVEAAKLKVEEW